MIHDWYLMYLNCTLFCGLLMMMMMMMALSFLTYRYMLICGRGCGCGRGVDVDVLWRSTDSTTHACSGLAVSPTPSINLSGVSPFPPSFVINSGVPPNLSVRSVVVCVAMSAYVWGYGCGYECFMCVSFSFFFFSIIITFSCVVNCIE